MQPVIKTLLEQMRITDSVIKQRKELLSFTPFDAETLATFAPVIAENLDDLVMEFFRIQTSNPEIALLIGDLDTLHWLQSAQRKYLLDLFSGIYDLEYVSNRLRIGLVHKRIGFEPRLYLSATHLLKELLFDLIRERSVDGDSAKAICAALDKLLYFDVTLIVETYIRRLVTEIETAKEKTEQYAQDLEERTRQLEGLSRVDPLTGLLNRRSMIGILGRELLSAQRSGDSVSLVYIDIDNFKHVNDQHGHKRGDEVLQTIGEIARSAVRSGDTCFRIGGDEFCILMPNCNERTAETGFCARFRERLAVRLPQLGVSMGVHTAGPGHYVTAVDLIEHADEAMFAAKRLPREHARA